MGLCNLIVCYAPINHKILLMISSIYYVYFMKLFIQLSMVYNAFWFGFSLLWSYFNIDLLVMATWSQDWFELKPQGLYNLHYSTQHHYLPLSHSMNATSLVKSI